MFKLFPRSNSKCLTAHFSEYTVLGAPSNQFIFVLETNSLEQWLHNNDKLVEYMYDVCTSEISILSSTKRKLQNELEFAENRTKWKKARRTKTNIGKDVSLDCKIFWNDDYHY